MTLFLSLTTRLCMCLLTLCAACSVNAAVRCTDTTGAVAYVDNALSCPTGYKVAGEVGAMPPVSAQDQAQGKAQAASDKRAADALQRQRLQQERAAAKAQFAAQKKASGKTKSCKSAELALKRAQDKYDDAPSAVSKSGKANNKPSKTPNHVVVREGDDKTSKAKRKARHGLENAQAKRDLACG